MPLNNCRIKLDLSWSKCCVISEVSRRPAVPANPPVLAAEKTQTTSATFQMSNSKYYIPAVTLSVNDITFLENIKQGFKRTITWNKHRSEITTQLKI